MAELKVYADLQTTPPIATSAGSYTHTQSTPSSTWTIVHGLGYNPAGVKVWDSANEEWEPASVSYPDLNTVVLDFAGNIFSGIAKLS